jgi:hypothetical protein
VAFEHWKVGPVNGAARQKLSRPELNCDLGGLPEIIMEETKPNLVRSEPRLYERCRLRKRWQIEVMVNMRILIRGICLIHEVYIISACTVFILVKWLSLTLTSFFHHLVG